MGLQASKEKELTKEEVDLVRSSWNVVMQNSEENGVALFKTFLYKYEYFSLFPKFKGIPLDQLPEKKVFRNHSLAIIRAIDNVIINLESKSKLKDSLNSIAEKHRHRNVWPHHFEELKQVILECIAELLKLPKESMMAWNKALGIAFSDIVKSIES